MGGWFSYLWWGGDPDVADPVSGLTRRDIYAVQKSWRPVYADCVGNGTELLKRLYRADPDTKEFFRMLRNQPEAEYSANPQFKAHVINLMSSLNMAITTLHQPEVVIAMMHKIGESHKKRDIQEKHFHVLTKVIVTMFTEVLHLDEATLASWGKTVAFLYKSIFEKLNKTESTRFARADPQTYDFFSKSGRPEKELLEQDKFKKHVISLMDTMDNAIKQLHRPEVVVEMMHGIGIIHDRLNIRKINFNEFKVVVLTIFIEEGNLDRDTLNAWSHAIEFFTNSIKQTLSS